MARISRVSAWLSWVPVAILVNDCVVECRYDAMHGHIIAVDKLSKHLGIELRKHDVVQFLDPTLQEKRFGRVLARSREWVSMDDGSGIRQVPKGSLCVMDDGRLKIVPEAVVSGRRLTKF